MTNFAKQNGVRITGAEYKGKTPAGNDLILVKVLNDTTNTVADGRFAMRVLGRRGIRKDEFWRSLLVDQPIEPQTEHKIPLCVEPGGILANIKQLDLFPYTDDKAHASNRRPVLSLKRTAKGWEPQV